jgi:molybdopterin molybdotransferase
LNTVTHRGIVDVRGARVVLSRFLLPVEIEQAGIINAFGRTLAEDLTTDTAIPPHNTAAKDGYAAIAADTTGATREKPKTVSILSHSSPIGKRLGPGTVITVRRDDPLPDCADTVIEPANTYRPENGPQLLILGEAEPGANVIPAGSTTPAGHVLLSQGTMIGGCEMELIASLGKHGVPVRRKPKVAIVTSGARVVDVVGEMQPGETRNRARYGLVGMVLGAGCDLGRLTKSTTQRSRRSPRQASGISTVC